MLTMRNSTNTFINLFLRITSNVEFSLPFSYFSTQFSVFNHLNDSSFQTSKHLHKSKPNFKLTKLSYFRAIFVLSDYVEIQENQPPHFLGCTKF